MVTNDSECQFVQPVKLKYVFVHLQLIIFKNHLNKEPLFKKFIFKTVYDVFCLNDYATPVDCDCYS